MSQVAIDFKSLEEECRATIADSRAKYKATEEDIHVVFYTDGGCRPAPRGVGGCGIHGYIYTNEIPKQGHGCKGFTPGAKGYANGDYGVGTPAVTVLAYIDGVVSIRPESSNNEAEVVALLNALMFVDMLGPASVHFKLDSEYALRGANEWLTSWVRNQWRRGDGSPVPNAAAWQKVRDVLTKVSDSTNLTWEWVKGHSDSLGNNSADYNATAGVNCGRNGIDYGAFRIYKPREYWNPDNDINRFICEPRWYFLSGSSHSQFRSYNFYHLGNHGPDNDAVGKPTSTTMYSVVGIPQLEPALEKVRDHHNRIADYNGVFISARLDLLLRPRTYRLLTEVGSQFFFRPAAKPDLYDPSDIAVTNELTPPRLAYRAADRLGEMETVLRSCLNGFLPGTVKLPEDSLYDMSSKPYYRFTEITDLLYETVAVKKESVLKAKAFLTETSHVKANVDFVSGGDESTAASRSVELVLTMDIDIPRRNFLAGISEHKPRVFVITWPEPSSTIAFRYATVILTEKECGIWSGVHSNLRIVSR